MDWKKESVNPIISALQKIEQQETRYFSQKTFHLPGKEQLTQKIPKKVETALATAFGKAFVLVFKEGTGIIEKSFDKEGKEIDFAASDYVVSNHLSKKSLKRIDKQGKKGGLFNTTLTTTTGLGLGFLGIGIPDIPLFIATLLKGIYEISLGYGFDYTKPEEQVYILRLIRSGINKSPCLLEEETSLEAEIDKTAFALANALLLEKFVQGIPIIGVTGGLVNYKIYGDITTLSRIWYKKRYLRSKLRSDIQPRQ